VEAARSDGDFQTSQCHRRGRGNGLAVVEPVFEMEANSVVDVAERFIIGLALRVASLQFRTVCEEAVAVPFNYDREAIGLHVVQHTERGRS